jgi:hypothetical protein
VASDNPGWLEESHRVQDKAEVPVTDTVDVTKVDPWGYGNNGGRLLVWRMLNA